VLALPVINWRILSQQRLLPACPCWHQPAHSEKKMLDFSSVVLPYIVSILTALHQMKIKSHMKRQCVKMLLSGKLKCKKQRRHCVIPSRCQGLFLHCSCQSTSSGLDRNIRTRASISFHCGRRRTTYTTKSSATRREIHVCRQVTLSVAKTGDFRLV